MTLKHKVLKEFQFLSPDKKIFILKAGTILEEYKYKVKSETIDIDRDIIDNNPEFFEVIDWKFELLSYLKTQKVPQPSQVHKKLVPFMEDMILSSMQQSPTPVIDEIKVKELNRKEIDINSREKRVKDKEEEIDIRLKRVEKREESYKEDIKELDKKEDSARIRSKDLIEKQLDIEDRLQDINERERNLDRSILESSKDIDVRYTDLQSKIDKDLRALSEREKDIELSSRDIKKRESLIDERESFIDDKIRNFELSTEDAKNRESDIIRLAVEIEEWLEKQGLHRESLSWKAKIPNRG